MSRISVLRLFFFLWCGAILARLFYWQILRSPDLTLAAKRQYERSSVSEPQRGKIFFADGRPLALNGEQYTLVGRPALLAGSPDSLSDQLFAKLVLFAGTDSARLIELGEKRVSFLAKLSDKNKKWVPLLSGLDAETKEALEDIQNPGITFEKESVRSYPEGSSAAHLVGFVGKNAEGEPQGYFGIEGKYNLELAARRQQTIVETDAVGHPIGMDAIHQRETGDGRDLTLTIQRDVQYIIESYAKGAIEKYGAKSVDVLVMDPATGAILASSSYPSYDPAHFRGTDATLFKNPVVADTYEPGSTFKVLTVAAGIDAGVITESTACDSCSGPVTIGKYTVQTWDNKYRAGTSIQDGLTHSDNTAMVFVGRKLGKEKFLSYLQAFGIGEKTGVDLQEESTSKLRQEHDWSEIDMATATFGQGIALTPIQMLTAVNTIANGGKLMRPYVVGSVRSDSQNFPTKPELVRQVIRPETAARVAEMMRIAASTGDAKWTLPKKYPIAGKTGTAQIPVAGHYDEKRTIASFVGFAPVENPKFSMIVRLVEPTSSQWGSETAAPLWFAIAKDLFVKYGITPNKSG